MEKNQKMPFNRQKNPSALNKNNPVTQKKQENLAVEKVKKTGKGLVISFTKAR